jgi:undecaprenyl-diphosphatase
MWIGYEPLFELNQTFFLNTINSELSSYTTFWRIVTSLGGFVFLSVLTLFTATYFYFKKNITDALIYVLGMLGGLILVASIKHYTAIDRPDYIYAIEETFSFPSGHTALSVIFLIVSGYLYAVDKSSSYKKLVLSLTLALSILIATSRLFLGEHWVMDIVGGYLLGLAVSTSIILFFTRGPARGK